MDSFSILTTGLNLKSKQRNNAIPLLHQPNPSISIDSNSKAQPIASSDDPASNLSTSLLSAPPSRQQKQDTIPSRKRKRSTAFEPSSPPTQTQTQPHPISDGKPRITATIKPVPTEIDRFERFLEYWRTKHSSGKNDRDWVSDLEETWYQNFGFVQDLTGIQRSSWGVILENRDLIAISPTGSGKTLAFLVPLLAKSLSSSPGPQDCDQLRPKVLILEPTRELANQVTQQGKKLTTPEGSPLANNDSITGARTKFQTLDDVLDQALNGKAAKEKPKRKGSQKLLGTRGTETILVSSPLKLVYALKNDPDLLSCVEHIVLDECDGLLSMGFLEQTDSILAACGSKQSDNKGELSSSSSDGSDEDAETRREVRKYFFSATVPSGIEELARSVMSPNMVRVVVGKRDGATAAIDQHLLFTNYEDSKLPTLKQLIRAPSSIAPASSSSSVSENPTLAFTPPVLIFLQSKSRATQLFAALTSPLSPLGDLLRGKVGVCHGDMRPEEREEIVRRFNGEEGSELWVLVTTDLVSRGLDFKGVRLVINYDFPQSASSYIHRIGRTGRAGLHGQAVTFFGREDAPYLRSIVSVVRNSGFPSVPEWMLSLNKSSKEAKKRLRTHPPKREDIIPQATHEIDGKKKKRRKNKA